MVYAYDLWLPMPTKDLYDTQMMTSAINAAKDAYNDSKQQLELFNKTYGDFYTPIIKDMKSYNNIVEKPVYDLINDLYARGIDPIRTQQGRFLLNKAIASVPKAEVNNLKASAKIAEEYLKNKAQLLAKGLYSDDYENFILEKGNLTPLEEWDTLKNGKIWGRRSPDEYLTLNQATSHWFDAMKGSGKGTKNGRTYFGIDDLDLLDVAEAQSQGFAHTLRGEFELRGILNLIKKQNPHISDEDLLKNSMKTLNQNIALANKEMKFMKDEADPVALENLRYRHDLARDMQKRKWDLEDQRDSGINTIFDGIHSMYMMGAKDQSYNNGRGTNVYRSVTFNPAQDIRSQFVKFGVTGATYGHNKKANTYLYKLPNNRKNLSVIRADRANVGLDSAMTKALNNGKNLRVLYSNFVPTGEAFGIGTKDGYVRRMRGVVIVTAEESSDNGKKTVVKALTPGGKFVDIDGYGAGDVLEKTNNALWNAPIEEELHNYNTNLLGKVVDNPHIRSVSSTVETR